MLLSAIAIRVLVTSAVGSPPPGSPRLPTLDSGAQLLDPPTSSPPGRHLPRDLAAPAAAPPAHAAPQSSSRLPHPLSAPHPLGWLRLTGSEGTPALAPNTCLPAACPAALAAAPSCLLLRLQTQKCHPDSPLPPRLSSSPGSPGGSSSKWPRTFLLSPFPPVVHAQVIPPLPSPSGLAAGPFSSAQPAPEVCSSPSPALGSRPALLNGTEAALSHPPGLIPHPRSTCWLLFGGPGLLVVP